MMIRLALSLVLICVAIGARAQAPSTGALPFFGATTTTAGVKGLVPAPAAADVLAGNTLGPAGAWAPSWPINSVTQTGGYTVQETDAQTVILVNCATPCTITMPQSTSSVFPTNAGVEIVSIGSPTGIVTVSATTSTIYGMPLVAGSVLLSTYGDYVQLQADASNNYLATGYVALAGGLTPGTFTNSNITVGPRGGITSVSTGTGGGGSGGSGAQPPTYFQISFQPGLLSALPLTTTAMGATKIPISATIDNITLTSRTSYTCSGTPTVSLRRCGTSATCASSTDRGSGNPSATLGTFVNVAVTDPAVPQSDYLAWEFSAGTCSAINVEATAMLHSNPGFCAAGSQMVFTTSCNSAMQSLL